jgi:hypothetical protein
MRPSQRDQPLVELSGAAQVTIILRIGNGTVLFSLFLNSDALTNAQPHPPQAICKLKYSGASILTIQTEASLSNEVSLMWFWYRRFRDSSCD